MNKSGFVPGIPEQQFLDLVVIAADNNEQLLNLRLRETIRQIATNQEGIEYCLTIAAALSRVIGSKVPLLMVIELIKVAIDIGYFKARLADSTKAISFREKICKIIHRTDEIVFLFHRSREEFDEIPNVIKKGLADSFNKFDVDALRHTEGLKPVIKYVHPIPKDVQQSSFFRELLTGGFNAR